MFEEIQSRMLDRVHANIDKRENSIIWNALAPAALEFVERDIRLDEIMENAFAETASREYLIRLCLERGITPEPATNAVLQGQFSPALGESLIGTRFSQPNGALNYVVREPISEELYKVECETAGEVGNSYLGTLLPIDEIPDLETAELISVYLPGTDEEDTEHLRERYFASLNGRSFGGNIADYREKTNAIEGVGATKVLPVWNGGGTVKLLVVDDQFNIPTAALVDKVQQIIDPTQDGKGFGAAPIGHIVTVETPERHDIKLYLLIDFGVESERTADTAKPIIEEALQKMFLMWRKKIQNGSKENVFLAGNDIIYAVMSTEIVENIRHLQVNGITITGGGGWFENDNKLPFLTELVITRGDQG